MMYKNGDKVYFFRKPYDSELFEYDTDLYFIMGTSMFWHNIINDNINKYGVVEEILTIDELEKKYPRNLEKSENILNVKYFYKIDFGEYSYFIPDFLLKNKTEMRNIKYKKILK